MSTINFFFHPADLVKDMGANELKGLKVTFINMPLRESAKPNTPPEGPGILASILRKYGAEPSIIDLNGYRVSVDPKLHPQGLNHRLLSYQEAERLIERHLSVKGDQDMIAFSGMITTLRWQETVAKIIRKYQPNAFLGTGGGLATELKEGLFNWMGELDWIAHSEGDDIILTIARDAKLIKELGREKAYTSNKLSQYHLGEKDSRHRFLYAGDRPKDLDELPYAAWDLLESDPFGHNVLEDYIKVPVWGGSANNSSATSFTMQRSLTTVSSRGCPYACAFCYRGAQGERNYGVRSAVHIAKQAKQYLDKYKVDFIGFPDDNFAVSKKRVADFLPVFTEHGINVRWGTHARLDEADERVMDMAKAGCIYIGFGAESASAPILERMNKGGFILKNGLTKMKVNGGEYEFATTMVNGIKKCREAGIHANCTWIMAYPGETLDDLKTSVAFIKWQQGLMTQGLTPGTPEYKVAYNSVNRKMFTATAYPGTAMFKDQGCRELLNRNFGISFTENGDPICDDPFHSYVLELDDATKVLHNEKGQPLNFGAMPMDTFLEAREYVDTDQIEKILDMKLPSEKKVLV